MVVISQKRLLDVKEAANYLSIPSVRIDNKRLFDVLELDGFVYRLKRERT